MNKSKLLSGIFTFFIFTSFARADELPPNSQSTIILTTFNTSPPKDFSDITQEHPYYNAINHLRSQGVFTGYPDNTFRPNQILNRVEALKLIFEISNLEIPIGIAPANFSDTSQNEWYSGFLNRAVFLEIVNGFPDGTFNPSQSVNTVEFLKMLLLAQKVDLSTSNQLTIPYNDVEPGQWYFKYINFAKKHNLLIADSKNNVFPAEPLTRGYAAEILHRFQKSNLSQTPSPNPKIPTTLTTSIESTDEFATFNSESYFFSIFYPKKWFYSSIPNLNENAIRTYGFGPENPLESTPTITLELLPNDKNFKTNSNYFDVSYHRENYFDEIIFTTQLPNSTRLYRLKSTADQEPTLLKMLSSLSQYIPAKPIN